ncbi:MAG: class I lanthipeptide [Bacteroidota bacterium]|nr:class I lanthipeptide [Bacteroidota bacterium]
MKSKKIKLQLNKEIIANLNEKQMNSIRGGVAWWTEGCTDGCAPFPSAWRCTRGACTDDCNTIEVCLSTPKCKSDFCGIADGASINGATCDVSCGADCNVVSADLYRADGQIEDMI